ncbi:MAG: hypothetical protein DMG76_25265 [Acidobacteria bacterium]|nr:MAG: hypothetical protein DMG76_25265 [Acidobacteriota bacterium]
MTTIGDITNGLSEEEELALPEDGTPASDLPAVWSRHDAIAEKKQADQINNELYNPNFSGLHRLTTPGEDAVAREKKERREHEIAYENFQRTMRSIQERTDVLLEALGEEERICRGRLDALNKRAIVMGDGRRVFVGGNGEYIDERDGHALRGNDRDEAHARHAHKLDAATWDERNEATDRYEKACRLRHEVLADHETDMLNVWTMRQMGSDFVAGRITEILACAKLKPSERKDRSKLWSRLRAVLD